MASRSRRAARTVTRYVTRPRRERPRRRTNRKKDMAMRMARDAAVGAGVGAATSIGLTMVGNYTNQPALREVGQRTGAILASHFGGTPGQVGYQVVDAVADRYVRFNGMAVSGMAGGV